MSLFCKADNHIHKDDIDMVLFTSSNKVIFKLVDGTSFQGNILTKKTALLNKTITKFSLRTILLQIHSSSCVIMVSLPVSGKI